jgi:hypothetical protein
MSNRLGQIFDLFGVMYSMIVDLIGEDSINLTKWIDPS